MGDVEGRSRVSRRRAVSSLCAAALSIATVSAQDTPKAPAQSAAEELAQALGEYRRASQPGAEHRWLEPLEGEWDMEVAWKGSDGTPRKVAGEATHRWVLGGRFLLSEAQLTEEGVPLEALSFYGFDANKKRYFALRLDSLSTDYLQLEGNYDVASRSFVLSGKDRDEMSGVQVTYRMRLHVPEPDRHSIELFVDYPGRGPVKILDAAYTRR